MKKNVLVITLVCLFTMFSSVFTGSLVYAEPIEVDTGIGIIFDNDVTVTDKVNTLREYGYNYSASALGGWLFDVNISGMFKNNRDRLTQADVRNEIEAYADLLLKNGGNKNYYTDNNYDTTNNYNVFGVNIPINGNISGSVGDISIGDIDFSNKYTTMNYTYNNQTYNNVINNSQCYYNIFNNSYDLRTTNNQNITYINNYNNTTIISPSGTTTLYYELPNGSNSLNLTEEDARKGYKTSLSVSSYSNGYDSDDLEFLYHFDNNEYNSAYPKEVNFSLIPNSIQYIDSQGGFGQALALSEDINLTIDTNNLYYSFRIYPLIKDKYKLSINGTDIAKRESYIDTQYDYVEWTQRTDTYETIGSTTSSTTGDYFYITLSGQSLGTSAPSVNGFTNIEYNYALVGKTPTNGNLYSYTATYRSNNKQTTSTSVGSQNISGHTSTTQRTYNIINNKLFEDEFCDLLNYNQWNYVAIKKDGSVYINGVSTDITIDNTIDFNIFIEQDGITYIDELVGFNTNHAVISTSMPFDSNVYYSLPLYYERVNSPGYIYNQLCNIGDPFFSRNYSISYVDGKYKYTQIDSNPRVGWYNGYNSSHIYYMYLKGTPLNGSTALISSYQNDEYIYVVRTTQPFEKSFIYTGLTTQWSGLYLQGGDIDFDNIVIVDLTLMFGYGYEPNLEWCDNNLKDLTYSANTSVTKSPYDIFTGYTFTELVDTSYAVNNQLLIQSLIPVVGYKFGGIRPSSPNFGYVYVVVDDYGQIKSIQQFNGIEWMEVKGAIYNSSMKLWVSAIGFNIFFTNWSVMPYDYETDSGIINTLVRFLRDQFDRLIEAIKGIFVDNSNNITNNITNSEDIDISVEINNQLNTGLNGLNNLDLENNPSYNLNSNHIDGVTSMGNFIKDTINDVVASPIGIMWTLPILLLLLGLVF